MAYTNNNCLSGNLEVNMLRTVIVVLTVIACVFSSTVDGIPVGNFTLWMYFLAIVPVIFVLTAVLKLYPHTALALLTIFLIVTTLIFKKYLFYTDGDFSGYKLAIVSMHFIFMIFFFWKALKTLVQDDVEADISMYNKSDLNDSNSRKLTRRKNRRANFRAKNSVKIKSGQYRG